jgi:beta-carotene hydroxylase
MSTTVLVKSPARASDRRSVHLLSRTLTVIIVGLALGTYFWIPETPLEWAADILLRTYLMFLGTVMAHEASHGQLGKTRRSNFFWGRLALVPCTVPYVNFRKTHLMHHVHTNDPDMDPDFFVKFNHWWEAPVRALLVPHNWIMWLKRHDMIKRRDVIEWGVHYVFIFALYIGIGMLVGVPRAAIGLFPALFLVSMLLWYPFAYFTHEGHSMGDSEHRSHNYYGKTLFWLTLGLSMHRVHHEHPRLAWIEALPLVEPNPRGFFAGTSRDIRPEAVAVVPAFSPAA